MPLNKNALLRYQLINECLTNPRKRFWSAEEIMEKGKSRGIRISKRTFNGDLEAMRYDTDLNYHAVILYKKNYGFYYEDPHYSIDRLPLSEDDIETFELMLGSIKRFKGASILSQVQGLIDKLEKVAGQLKIGKTKLAYAPILFEPAPYNKGITHFDAVYSAIINQKPLLVGYKKFDHEKGKEHVFHPYLVKEYKFRWYALGYSEKSKKKIVLALDRMESVAPIKIPFVAADVDVEHYFDHLLGVTVNANGVKEIKLWFTPGQGNYIKTQPIHESHQIESDTKYGLIVTLQLIQNYELLQTLLAFGPEVKVLEPASLREEMKAMLEKSLRLYEE